MNDERFEFGPGRIAVAKLGGDALHGLGQLLTLLGDQDRHLVLASHLDADRRRLLTETGRDCFGAVLEKFLPKGLIGMRGIANRHSKRLG
jgi:hypothetical protein